VVKPVGGVAPGGFSNEWVMLRTRLFGSAAGFVKVAGAEATLPLASENASAPNERPESVACIPRAAIIIQQMPSDALQVEGKVNVNVIETGVAGTRAPAM
jgi:hypothetical protein